MKNCHITAKLGNMRKAVSWIVYPNNDCPKLLRLQSDHRCAVINRDTGVGRLSKHVANYPRFGHCEMDGSQSITVDMETVQAAIEAEPKSGDQVGRCLFIA